MFLEATTAVAPEILISRHLVPTPSGAEARLPDGSRTTLKLPLFVAAIGKAAARMALGCERALGPAALRGLVVTADGCEVPLEAIDCLAAGHPVPDERGLAAAQRLVERLGEWSGDTLFLVSGGASSLLVQPRPPVSLPDKISASRLLLLSSADIGEFNTVRKHLSLVKGGGLLRHTRGRSVSLILSDVVGDDPATIGSGPSVADPTTFADARAVLERRGLLAKVPASVRALLEAGCSGGLDETVKPTDVETRRSRAAVIGSNRIALEAAASLAASEGWVVRVLPEPLEGDTGEAARFFAKRLAAELVAAPGGGRVCVLAGGETTVAVTGSGKGGRNQEFALEVARHLAGLPIHVLSAGSDGIDGPTDAAGAFVDGGTVARARAAALDPEAALSDNDSYRFFLRLDDLYLCGATGTNVMDLKLALVQP